MGPVHTLEQKGQGLPSPETGEAVAGHSAGVVIVFLSADNDSFVTLNTYYLCKPFVVRNFLSTV